MKFVVFKEARQILFIMKQHSKKAREEAACPSEVKEVTSAMFSQSKLVSRPAW